MHILKFFEYFGGGTVKKAIAVVESGCDKGVNECFSSGLAECGAEAGNVTEMVESSFCDVVDMGFEGEGGVQDDTKVADVGGGGDGGVVNVKGEISGGAGEGIWTNDDYFRFIAV